MSRPGPINFIALLVNDSYKGLDQSSRNQVYVKEAAVSRNDIDYNYNDV
jgi:hypothetical protein